LLLLFPESDDNNSVGGLLEFRALMSLEEAAVVSAVVFAGSLGGGSKSGQSLGPLSSFGRLGGCGSYKNDNESFTECYHSYLSFIS